MEGNCRLARNLGSIDSERVLAGDTKNSVGMSLSLKRDKTACYLPVFEAAKAADTQTLNSTNYNQTMGDA